MHDDGLLRFGGEFRDTGREAAFQAARLPETLRQCRLIFLLSAVLNALFLISDWRFHGTPHFFVAVPARLAVVFVSIVCALLIRRVATFRRAEAVTLLWEGCVAVGVAFLVSSRSDLALFVVMLLPAIFYLVAPISFRWTLPFGAATSLLMLAGYLGGGPLPTTFIGLILILVMLNVALSLVVIHANRLRRLEWQATQSERAAKEALGESRAMIERLFMAVPIPLVVTSVLEGRFLRANDAALRYLGGRAEADLGSVTVSDMFVEPESRRELLRQLYQSEHVGEFEARIRDAGGTSRDALITATSLTLGQAPAVVAGIVDITERKAAEAQARWQATHDALTGLPNRLLFQERLQAALAALGEGATVSLFLIDLDDFKSVNDTLGHDAGDALLIEAAIRLSRHVEPDDLVARLGGDEFVVLSTRAFSPAAAQAKADLLLAALRVPVEHAGQAISARASLGIALAPQHDREPVELMKDADLALYRAKALGRNMAVIYEPDMRAAMNARVAICRELGEALAQDRILPFYQPQIVLATGAIDGFEALARWRHPQRGIVPAAAFQQALEDPETSQAIGDAILRQAIADLRGWLEAGIDVPRVWVNLAPGVFRDPSLPQKFLALLDAAGVPAERFGVEVTETVLLTRNGGDAERALKALRESGVRVALDDFGTGYASLTHLRRLPVDLIKIDRSFVRHLAEGGEDAAIVRAIINLAADMKLDVIAEGVESREQQEFLLGHGCGFGQGYRYSRPIAASRVPWLVRQGGLLPAEPALGARRDGIAAA
ncbi:EAL domain-containing protein [Bosea caraganae]|uniref:EAL domain-containing protein n=1 Tax=Bosea caraganae TaxID=2763117 RepID=A0A370L4X8_9HYPH|nr:EAL domain-containing protein [Bosea caraganae]RDJ22301.1 EAL domain-containing protein [Bosea caraganae]RDJ23765.1 EAL domain-containing protein [Bosea caraganae]